MKILCVIDNLGSGGAQRQMVGLALGFHEKGHEVHFLTYYNIPFFESIVTGRGISVACTQDSNYLRRLYKMRRFIRKGNFDAVLSFLDASNFICEASGFPVRRWKLVVGERNANPEIGKTFRSVIYRWAHFFSDYIVTNSYANLKLILSVNPFLSRKKTRIIYNMIDFRQWKPSENYVPRKDGKLKMIVCASHQYRKNLSGLVEALARLSSDELKQITVYWYGDRIIEPYVDSSYPEARKKIKRLELEQVFHFFPATDEITEKIQQADAVGLFSFYEGLPNIVCEGMACAKPVICSAISDIPEILSDDPDLLFDPYDPESIKRSISHLIHFSDKELIETGKRNERIAREKFITEKQVNGYLELLKK